MTTSRTKPITRDASVIPDTIMPDLINFLLKTRPLELSEEKNAVRIGRQFNRLPSDTPPRAVFICTNHLTIWLGRHISGPFQYTR